MLPELALFSLILALCLAFIQSSLPLFGSYRNNFELMQLARYCAIGQFIFIGFSFFSLIYLFLINDFSLVYIVRNSNTSLPWFYRIGAVWGAHEGSILLWTFILSVWTAVLSFSEKIPLEILSRILSVLGIISLGFLLFLITLSNPFLRDFNIPSNGFDLNPILQDPGLMIHPPILYIGYVGFAVPFAFAVAALISKKFTAVWASWMRSFVLLAWSFLTLGITLGSWWAYRELGWGGWWFWDPVENASFLPWLSATALIHALIAVQKRNAFKNWTIILALITFSLSLLGTFLVRSGILISVHAFAQDPARGDFMLVYLITIIGLAFTLYAWRGQSLQKEGYFQICSKETLLLCNTIFFTIAMATVLLGTLYPLILQVLNLDKISVGAPYFNKVFVPIILPALFLMGLGPHIFWRQMSAKLVLKKMWFALLLSVSLAIFLVTIFAHQWNFTVIGVLSIAFWIIISMLKKLPTKQYGMIFAHIGVAVVMVGIVCQFYGRERDVRVHAGDSVAVGQYKFQFLGTREINGENYTGIEAGIRILDKQDNFIALLQPQERLFNVAKIAIAKTAINIGLFRDLYVALGNPIGKQDWTLRIYYKPLIRWIWGGGILILAGGMLALTTRRYDGREK